MYNSHVDIADCQALGCFGSSSKQVIVRDLRPHRGFCHAYSALHPVKRGASVTLGHMCLMNRLGQYTGLYNIQACIMKF